MLESVQYIVSGKSVKLLHFTWCFPFPTESVTELLSDVKTIIDIEQNGTSQPLHSYVNIRVCVHT